MIGERFLKWKLKWNKHFSYLKRESKAYSQAKKIGIIIKNDNPKYNEGIEKMVRNYINEGKMVEVLCYQINIVNSKYNFPFFSFSKKELKWNGEIENSHFKKLIETKYDYLISISDEMDIVLEYMLKKSPALLRIGNAGVHKPEHVDLMVQKGNDKNLSELAVHIFEYSKKLK
ncbi:hypothetical protein HZR84_02005 [Hyphobacterium sp. CCMP332]|nr:hypothetical protein HZR84_02005 [Hyphobacterium sp. CCMP332]